MLRTWNYAWWKPVVGLVVFLGLFVLAQLVIAAALLVVAALRSGPVAEDFEQLASLDEVTPTLLLVINLSLGAMILVAWLTVRLMHRMRPRWLASVAPKLRWRFFFVCVGLSVVALVAQIVVGLFLPGGQETDVGAVNDFTRTTLVLALVVLLTTPLQAAGEEYVFRGYLMQAIGSFWSFSWAPPWVARWVAIVATATMFALAHGAQNFPLFFDRFTFGLIAGWLVIRTGGLEVGIAMHILNNFLAFGFALSFGDLGESLNISEVGWGNIILTVTQAGVYAVLVLLVAKKMNVQRRTDPPRQRIADELPGGPSGEPDRMPSSA